MTKEKFSIIQTTIEVPLNGHRSSDFMNETTISTSFRIFQRHARPEQIELRQFSQQQQKTVGLHNCCLDYTLHTRLKHNILPYRNYTTLRNSLRNVTRSRLLLLLQSVTCCRSNMCH